MTESAKIPMPGLTEGRMVHFVMNNSEHRAAVIVKVWDNFTGYCNLRVFYDGTNDASDAEGDVVNGWVTSVEYSATPKPRSWHWMERA